MSLSGVLARKGAAVTFTKTAPGTHDPTTGTFGAPTVTTVECNAMRVPGDPVLYKALGLIESESPTLLCTPKTRGEKPSLEMSVEWGDHVFHVKHVNPLELNGVVTAARVVVSR